MRAARIVFATITLALAGTAAAQTPDNSQESYLRLHYHKQEQMIPMRDGVNLFTAIYVPRDTTRKYPILMKRTPYSVAPYSVDKYPSSLGPSEHTYNAG